MAPGKAPSEGTKVTMGKDAPSTSAATGAVASDSLAAESQTFLQSNNVAAQQPSSEALATPSKPRETTQAVSASGAASSAGAAPSYVSDVYLKDPSGPHGKNIKEDNSIGTEDKTKNTSFSEFGTNNDPGMAAEQKFALADAAAASSTGARQTAQDGKTPYDALGSEKEA